MQAVSDVVSAGKQRVQSTMDGVHDYFGGWFWPVALVGVFVLTQAGRKCYLMSMAGWHLAVSQDKSMRLPNYNPGAHDEKEVSSEECRRLILIRHGRSTWNEVFNRGINWKLPLRMLYSLTREAVLFVTSDSCLIDAPLDSTGVRQAAEIGACIAKQLSNQDGSVEDNALQLTIADDTQPSFYLALLDGSHPSESAMVVSSPLRRCLETVSLGLFARFERSLQSKKVESEKIVVLSSLQEMTRNVDGMSLSGEKEMPPVSFTLRGLESQMQGYSQDWDRFFASHLDVSSKDGFKSAQKRGDDRLRAFVAWLFRECPSQNVIVSGHSLYFRSLFSAYLPRESKHCGKTAKIRNGGVVALKLYRTQFNNGTVQYRIEENSIVPVIAGFEDGKHTHLKSE